MYYKDYIKLRDSVNDVKQKNINFDLQNKLEYDLKAKTDSIKYSEEIKLTQSNLKHEEMAKQIDAIVVGSGPNGLSAAIEIARSGYEVCVYEAKPTVGGGMRTLESTIPGFLHDHCSAVHPLGILSPFF